MDWKRWIEKNLFRKTGNLNGKRSNEKWITKNHPKIYNKLVENTSYLPADYPINIRIYCLYYNISSLSEILCKNCRLKIPNFIDFKKGFNDYCSMECVGMSQSVKQTRKNTLNKVDWGPVNDQRKQTKKERYGNENYSNADKREKTNLEKYGYVCSLNHPEIKQKSIKTNLEKYNSEYFMGTDLFFEKSKNTIQKLYKTDNCMYLDKFKEDVKRTKKERYGNGNYNNADKREKTNLEKYGYKSASKNSLVKEKTIKTNLEKYSVPFFSQSDIFKQKAIKTNLEKYSVSNWNKRNITNIDNLNKDFIEANFLDGDKYVDIKQIQDYYNISLSLVYRKLKNFDIYFKTPKSKFENEIYDFLLKHFDFVQVIKNDRTVLYPLELDFYLPDYNLAIEFNGLYWHSETILNNKKYHLNKTKLCEKKNIQLIHIFQNQWEEKENIIKSIILSKLNIFKHKYYARKCKIKEISATHKKVFLEQNHLQGNCNSSINLGLYSDDELLSVMTFGKRNITSKSQFELIRFCSKMNTQIIGSASKLFKFFINNLWDGQEIISYANRQHSDGGLYEILGFQFIHNTQPNYFYYKGNCVLKRNYCQKHKLKFILENFNEQLTEYENMLNHGFQKIYDSGNKLYKYQ